MINCFLTPQIKSVLRRQKFLPQCVQNYSQILRCPLNGEVKDLRFTMRESFNISYDDFNSFHLIKQYQYFCFSQAVPLLSFETTDLLMTTEQNISWNQVRVGQCPIIQRRDEVVLVIETMADLILNRSGCEKKPLVNV